MTHSNTLNLWLLLSSRSVSQEEKTGMSVLGSPFTCRYAVSPAVKSKRNCCAMWQQQSATQRPWTVYKFVEWGETLLHFASNQIQPFLELWPHGPAVHGILFTCLCQTFSPSRGALSVRSGSWGAPCGHHHHNMRFSPFQSTCLMSESKNKDRWRSTR